MAKESLWLIEAPGPHYLSTRCVGHSWDFYWTSDHDRAIGFSCEGQCKAVMLTLQQKMPEVFPFATVLCEPRAVEHMWVNGIWDGAHR